MDKIITRIYDFIKETNNSIEFEEQIQLLMYDTLYFTSQTILDKVEITA